MKNLIIALFVTLIVIMFGEFTSTYLEIRKAEVQNESRKTDIEVNRLIDEVCQKWGEFKNGRLECFSGDKKYSVQEL